ncbi:hypothetical protein A2U01_0106136, partial [Trifolium medium]|nr:hypothetical protein [Trifolium medium]
MPSRNRKDTLPKRRAEKQAKAIRAKSTLTLSQEDSPKEASPIQPESD